MVADIGATNVRFAALTDGGAIGPVSRFAVRNFPDITAALDAFVQQTGTPRPARLALAIAGPIFSDEVKITNAQWHFSIRDLKQRLKLKQLAVVNDFEAQALSLPYLGNDDLIAIGQVRGTHSPNAPRAVLGPGTGMGMAGLIRIGDRWHAVTTEGGYTSLSPLTDREIAVWHILRKRHGRVSVERVLSGPGLVELYQALLTIEEREPETVTSEQIVHMARTAKSKLAVESIELFCAWLGDVAGDAALMFLARGGVFLTGSILNDISEVLKHSRFRERFENKGRAASFIKTVPTYLITTETSALLGCARQLDLTRGRPTSC